MAKQSINVGTTANDKKGDSLRAAFQKVNANFTELYTALGLTDVTLNLGAFTFTGSTMSTDDSTNIVIDKPITVNGEITVDGDITPKTNLGASLGTPTRQFKSLYVSDSTVYFGGIPLSVEAGSNTLKINNVPISQTIDISDLTDTEGLLGGGGGSIGNISNGTGPTTDPNSLVSSASAAFINFASDLDGAFGLGTNDGSLVKITTDGGASAFEFTADNGAGSIKFPDLSTQTTAYNPNSIRSEGDINIEINLSDSTLRRWQFGEDGELTFPDGYLKIVPNGANPYISNRIDNGFGLVSGSAIQIRQSVADAYGISINSSITDTSLGDGSLLASGSNIDVNGSKIVLGQYTSNYLDSNTGLTGQNKIEINNSAILIGLDVSTLSSGTTTSAFSGWTFNSQADTLTFPDNTVQTTAWTGIANALRSETGIYIDVNLSDSTLRRWQFGEDGKLTLPTGANIFDNDGPGGGWLSLAPANAGIGQALVIYPTGGIQEGDHIHLTANGGDTELYLGNDYHYVKLVNGGNVEVKATTANFSDTASWTFGTDGSLASDDEFIIKAPNGVPTSVYNYSGGGGWNSPPYTNLATTTNNLGTGLTVNVSTAVGGYIDINAITINTPGTGYKTGDLITITNELNLTGSFVVGVAGTNSWTFGTSGSLTLPIGVSIDSSVSALYPKIIADSGKLFSVQGQGSTGSAAMAWSLNPNTDTQYAAVGVNKGGGDDLAKVVLTAGNTTATLKVWKFDQTGAFTFPDGTIQTTAAAPAFSFSVAADDSTQRAISNNELIKFIGAGTVTTASDAEGNITITGSGGGSVSSLVNGAYTVSLGSTGTLTVPANGIITAPINQEFQLQAKDANSVLRNEINLDPNNGTYMSVWSDGETSFSSAAESWATASWNNEEGLGAARFTDAQDLQNFWLTGPGSIAGVAIEASINGGARTPNVFYENNNGETYGVFLGLDAVPPGGQGTTVPITSLVFYYRLQSKINMDVDGGEILVDAQGLDLDLRTTNILDLRANQNLNLRGLGAAYPVRIYTNNNTRIWEFDSTGSLTLPSDGKIYGIGAGANDRYGYMSWDGESSGDGSGFNTMRLVPDQNLESVDQYIILDPTGGVPGHIHIRAGGTQDNSLAHLYLGGEHSHVKISAGLNPPVTVMSNDNAWIFGTSGDLTIPGDIKGTANTSIIVDNVVLFANVTVEQAQPYGPSGSRVFISESAYPTLGSIVQVGDTVTIGWGAPITVTITNITGGGFWELRFNQIITAELILNPGTITITSAQVNTWTFDNDGGLTFPDGTVQTTAWTGTFSTLSVTGAVTAERFNTDQITVVGNRISTTVTNANLELECNGSGGVVINAVADATTASTVKSVGYLGLPQSATATSGTLAISDAGKHIYVTTAGQTIAIPDNSLVAYPIGTTLTFIAGPSATTVLIVINQDTLRLAGSSSTGTRTLAANGMATAVKVTSTLWYINGTGLT
jgi:hypothetical protein